MDGQRGRGVRGGMMAEDMGDQGRAHGLGGGTGDCWILGTMIEGCSSSLQFSYTRAIALPHKHTLCILCFEIKHAGSVEQSPTFMSTEWLPYVEP